jgi:hypothetical protein
MSHKQYFKRFNPLVKYPPAEYCVNNGYVDTNNSEALGAACENAGFINPNDNEAVALLCPARGYYDPSEPIPYIPDSEIPEITPDAGEIILFMSTQWDAAINTTVVTVGTGAKARYTVYGADNAQIYTLDVNSNTAFFYEFPSSGGILLSNGFYGFKVVIKIATTGTLSTFKFTTKSGYAPAGWPVIEAHINAPTLTALSGAFDGQKALKYVKFYSNHNALTSLSTVAQNCTSLKEFHANIEMSALTTMASAFSSATELETLTLPASLPLLQSLYCTFQLSGLKTCPPLPNSLPECTTMRQTFYSMPRLTGTLYVPDAPKCTDVVYVGASMPNVTKIVFRGSYIPNNGTTIQLCSTCPLLEEIDMSNGDWGKAGVTWNLANAVADCPSLKTLKLPLHIISLTGASSFGTCNSLVTLTEADWSASPKVNFGWYLKSLENFYQPTYNINSGYIALNGTSSAYTKLKYLEIDWANCLPQTAACSIQALYGAMNQTELERIYTALPNISTGYSFVGTLKFFGNPGYNASNRAIATAKGWVFANF